MKKIGLFAGLLVFFALAGMASALEWTGYVGIDNLHYFGGISHSSRGEGSNVESYTLINHGTGFEITLLQGGQNVNRVSPGAADVTIRLTTNATVEYSQFASDLNPNSAPTAPSSGVDITPYFSSAAYDFSDGVYKNPKCKSTYTGLEGIHMLNYRELCGGHLIYEPFDLNCNRLNELCCWKGDCDSKSTYNSPVDITIRYKPAGEQNDPDPAWQTADGMGKGYLYCKGNLYVNGADAGEITSNDQTFTATTNIVVGMTTLPVEARYECYFISELYDRDGSLQKVENVVHQMPNNAPITPTANVNIIPPTINLIPFIRIGTTDYDITQIIHLIPGQKYNLTFLVQRDDLIRNITTPNMTWFYSGTPPEIAGPPVTTNTLFNPPLVGGDPPYILLTPPTEVTICEEGKETDTITFRIDSDNMIPESNENDNVITITINCTAPPDINLIPWIRINTTNYTGTTTITFRQNTVVNMSFIVIRTDTWGFIPTNNLTWTYTATPPDILMTVPPRINTILPPLVGGSPPFIVRNFTDIMICEGDKETDTITFTINPDGTIIEGIYGDNTITINIICRKDDVFECDFQHPSLVVNPGESWTNDMVCRNSTKDYVDCPNVGDDEVSWGGSFFRTYFDVPTWNEIIKNSQDAYQFNIRAIESGQPEIAYRGGEVSVNIEPEGDEKWKGCDFDLIWRRPDCRYYM